VTSLLFRDEIEIEIKVDVSNVERLMLLVVPRQSSCVGGFVIDVLMLVMVLIPHPRVEVQTVV